MECEYAMYDRIILLAFDIEKHFEDKYSVVKLWYHFNKNNIERRYVKPYVIKFKLTEKRNIDEQNDNVENYTEYKWSLEDIYNNLHFIPLFYIDCFNSAQYGCVDINDTVYAIKDTNRISDLLSYEDISYEFELRNGHHTINDTIIDTVTNTLTKHNIHYTIHIEDDIKRYISIYGIYEEMEPNYKIIISLDGREYKDTGYTIVPVPVEYQPYYSLGKFKLFNRVHVNIPNDEHLALIYKCPDCKANVICNWLSIHGTTCPYCDNMIKISA